MRDILSRKSRITRLLGRKDFERFRKTHWIIWIPVVIVPAALACAFPYAHFAGDALRWFVQILQLPQILKAPILEEHDLYWILSALLFAYLSTAVLLDLARYIRRTGRRDLVVADDSAYMIEWMWTGPSLVRLPYGSPGFRVEFRTGFFRRILGMERFYFHFPDRTIASPFFSRRLADNSHLAARFL